MYQVAVLLLSPCNIDFVTFFLVFMNSSLEVSVVSKWLTFLLIGRSVELDWQTFYLLTIYFEYFLCCFPSVFQLWFEFQKRPKQLFCIMKKTTSFKTQHFYIKMGLWSSLEDFCLSNCISMRFHSTSHVICEGLSSFISNCKWTYYTSKKAKEP